MNVYIPVDVVGDAVVVGAAVVDVVANFVVDWDVVGSGIVFQQCCTPPNSVVGHLR